VPVAEEPARPLDRVDRAEDAAQQLTRGRGALERDEVLVELVEVLVALDEELVDDLIHAIHRRTSMHPCRSARFLRTPSSSLPAPGLWDVGVKTPRAGPPVADPPVAARLVRRGTGTPGRAGPRRWSRAPRPRCPSASWWRCCRPRQRRYR